MKLSPDPAPVAFDARGFAVVKMAAVHGAPEVGVKLEIRATPLVAHGVEQVLQMLLRVGMCSIQGVPGAAAPPTEGHLGCGQRRAVGVLHEPVRMLLKQMRIGFSDEWGHPDGRLEAAPPNLFEHAQHVAAESFPRLEPIAHGRLIAVVDLNVFQARDVLGDLVQIIENLLRGDARSEAIPGAPAGGRRGEKAARRMVPIDARRHTGRRVAGRELFQIPRLAWRQLQVFGIHHHFERSLPQEKSTDEAMTGGEGQGGRTECQQARGSRHSLRLRNFVVLRFGIAKIHGVPERAGGLRQHLKALAIMVCIGWQIERNREQHYLLHPHRRIAGVDQFRLAELAGPVALQLQFLGLHPPGRVTECRQAQRGLGAMGQQEARANAR